MKRGIKPLILTFNYYFNFLKGVAVRIKYLEGIKYLLSTFSSSLVCAQLELPGLLRSGWCAGEQSCSPELLLSSPPLLTECWGFIFCMCNYTYSQITPPVRVIYCFFLCVNTTSDWSLNCSLSSYIFPAPPRPVGELFEGKTQGSTMLPGYGLSQLPGCTHSEALEKCPSESLQIKHCRQKHRWSSVRRPTAWSKNYVMCKDGEKSKLCIQDMEAVVLLPWGALVQPSEGCWGLHCPTHATASTCRCGAIARKPHTRCSWWSCLWLLAAEAGCTNNKFPSN